MRKALLLGLLLVGCGKPASAPAPVTAPDPPEVVFEKFRAAYIAADVKAMWPMFTARFVKEREAELANIKSLKDEKLKEFLDGTEVKVSTAEARKMNVQEFMAVMVKAMMSDPEMVRLYRSLAPKFESQENRVRITASSTDKRFKWVVLLAEDNKAWRVDEVQVPEPPADVIEVGKDKK